MERFIAFIFHSFIFLLAVHITHENLNTNLNTDKISKRSSKGERVDLLLSKLGNSAKLTRHNNSTKTESEIAAVFFGVAYGAPTHESSVTTTTTLKTTTTLASIFLESQTSSRNFFQNKNTINSDNKKSSSKTNAHKILHPDSGNNSTSVLKRNEFTISYDEELKRNKSDDLNSESKERTQVWIKIVDQLGIAWELHVHIFEFLFCLVATVAFICLLSLWCLKNKLSYKIFFIIYGSIILISCVRSILLFLDPYGIYEYLPHLASCVLHNAITPFIVTVLSLFLYHLTNSSCVDLVLLPKYALFGMSIFITVTMIIISFVIQFTNINHILNIFISVMNAIIATWGAVLCLGFVVVLLKTEKINSQNKSINSRVELDNSRKISDNTKNALRIGTAAGFSQLLISGLIVYSLVGPRDSPGSSYLLTWAWWLEHTLARLLEAILCLCITIATAYLSLPHQNFNKSPFIFPVFKICQRAKSSGVHPSKANIRQPLDIFTLQKSEQDRVDYVTSDFQLVWTQNRNQSNHYESNTILRRENTLPVKKTNDIRRNLTLPSKRYDPPKPYTGNPFYETIGEEYDTIDKYNQREKKKVVINNYKFLHSNNKQQPRRSLEDFCTISGTKRVNSSPAHSPSFYWSPMAPNSEKCEHFNPYSREHNSLDQISEANTVSHSDVHIDYLTDVSSSVDAISIGSEVTPYGGNGGRWNPSHTLPFKTFNPNPNHESKTISKDVLSRSETNTPLLEQEANFNFS